MISNLNEKCLLKFLSGKTETESDSELKIINLLRQYNIDVKVRNFNELYDIIDEYENN